MEMFETEYSFILKYEDQINDPSRVFYAFGEMIDSFKSIDNMLLRTVNRNAKSRQSLMEIKEGSLIAKMKSSFEIPQGDLEAEDDQKAKKLIDYMKKSRKRFVQGVMEYEKIDDISKILEIQNKLAIVAKETGADQEFLYTPPPLNEVVRVVSDFVEVGRNLKNGEKLQLSSDNEEIEVPIGISIDREKIELTTLTKKIDATREMILKVKKPDYLGESKWELKHGTDRIDAKIIDQGWLKGFHEKSIPLYPGDSILSDVHIIEDYDKFGNLIHAVYEIVKIKEVIPGEVDDE